MTQSLPKLVDVGFAIVGELGGGYGVRVATGKETIKVSSYNTSTRGCGWHSADNCRIVTLFCGMGKPRRSLLSRDGPHTSVSLAKRNCSIP
jgi:hypothetical protein